ncbi:MAG TPA: acyltransferase domain-containing protein, partial [Polyangiales bacterium]|nr:acyltransferase domain-containing protein [Polyangiales bacterium]
RLRDYLQERPEVALPDVALTLATRRTHFARRAAVVAKDRQVLLDTLASLGAGEAADALVYASEEGSARGKVAFVFPGQGSQWPEMGKQLLERSVVFAQSVLRCDAALAPHTGWSVFALLRGDREPDALERIEVVQPALFTMMVSLAKLWRELGVEPQAVIGHSQGELAAACVAGALSLEDAAKVVARRSAILTRVVGLGGSAAVEMPVPELEARLAARWGERLAVAAWNGARSAVVSGEQGALQELLSELEREQVFARRLRMTVASHSAQMDPLEDEVKAQLRGVRGRAGALPMYSTVLAQRIAGDELSPDYWYRNLREPVRFVQTLQHLLADGYRTFLEVSPHPILSLAVESAAEAAETSVHAFGSLRRDEDADGALKLALAKLHTAGHVLPLERVVHAGARPHDALPTYAFDRQRYWAEPERSAANGGMVASE